MSTSPENPVEHHPIPSIRPLPKRGWAIPISGNRREIASRYPNLNMFWSSDKEMDYADSCKELGDLGFSRLHSVKSIPHDQLKYAREGMDLSLCEFSLWHHPSGLVLAIQSGDLGKANPGVSSMTGHFQLDMGAGVEFSIIGGTKIQASGTTIVKLDGTRLRVGSITVSPGSGNLVDHLIKMQKHGRLVPLENWAAKDYFHIPKEFMFPLFSPGPWRGKDMEKEIQRDPALATLFIQDMEQAIPAHLWRPLKSYVVPSDPATEVEAPKSKEHSLHSDWMAVEYSLKAVSEGLFLNKKRFPGGSVREHVEHWMRVALGKEGEDMSKWRVDKPEPGGISLATVLLYTASEPSHERLLRLIRERPAEEVKKWCTQPDGAGFVLGQRLIDRAFINTSVEKPDILEKQLLEVYEALLERVGAENVKLITPLRSALGVWIEHTAGQSDYALSSMLWRRELASRLMLRMVGDGLDWNGPLNWRTYPNVVDSSQDNRPKFLTMGPDPVSPDQWVGLTGDNVRGTGLLSALVEADMDRSLPLPEESSALARPKARF